MHCQRCKELVDLMEHWAEEVIVTEDSVRLFGTPQHQHRLAAAREHLASARKIYDEHVETHRDTGAASA